LPSAYVGLAEAALCLQETSAQPYSITAERNCEKSPRILRRCCGSQNWCAHRRGRNTRLRNSSSSISDLAICRSSDGSSGVYGEPGGSRSDGTSRQIIRRNGCQNWPSCRHIARTLDGTEYFAAVGRRTANSTSAGANALWKSSAEEPVPCRPIVVTRGRRACRNCAPVLDHGDATSVNPPTHGVAKIIRGREIATVPSLCLATVPSSRVFCYPASFLRRFAGFYIWWKFYA
jgi:hypothetical protein